MKRRDFVAGVGLGGLATGLAGCAQSESTANCDSGGDGQTWKWNMVTSWPPLFPGLGTGADYLARSIEAATGGRIKVKVYAAGELVPALEVFDAVASGAAQLGHTGPYYWKGKSAATQLFGAVPFGMNALEQSAWMNFGGGHELYQKLYARFNLVPFIAGHSGVQMGGWFNREINSIDDIKGLKMRIPGLGGEVFKRAGGVPVNRPGGEIFTALQTGDIDATEWVGPGNDLSFGFYKAARYYYYPGWHEPNAALECIINKDTFNELPDDLQTLVRIACDSTSLKMLAEYTYMNPRDLKTLVEKHGVELREFPADVMTRLKEISLEMLDEMAAADSDFGEIYGSYKNFFSTVKPWHNISEEAYYRAR
ncbi:MAG: TRAP transporter substrate-binding protein [Gammaproteobacteria bacterium]|nr:TRAP transporter substrate-binding protein [Gammaproteobacteria bacterium]